MAANERDRTAYPLARTAKTIRTMKDRNKIIPGRNYGSIPHLSDSKLGKHDKYIHEGQERIIREGGRDKHDVVIVSLKLDGTNVGVVKKDGQLVTLQRKGYDCASSPYRQHHEFDKWVHENYAAFDSLLSEGERVVGEWMWQASGIKYKIQGPPFFAFDLFRADGNRAAWSELVLAVDNTPFTTPIHFVYSRAVLMKVNDYSRSNFPPAQPLDGLRHEGWIYRVERKGKFDFMAKWVRPDFEPGKYLPGLCGNPVDAPLVLNELA